jgi:DNA mismatch repair protein MutS2
MESPAHIPSPLAEYAASALEWHRLRERLAAGTHSPLGRDRLLTLSPSADAAWIDQQQSRNAAMRRLVTAGASFDFRGIVDPTELLDQARIEGAALEALDLRRMLLHAERVEAWRVLLAGPPDGLVAALQPMRDAAFALLEADLMPLLRALRGKIAPDGTLADDASPELARIRRALERQHRAIEHSLQAALSRLAGEGSTQESLITVRGERFVIPVRSEFKRKVGGVIHGSSSSGQTVFVEPMETIELNNELTRLLDDEQEEIHRILVAMTSAVAAHAPTLALGAVVLGAADAHQAAARFAEDLRCVRPIVSPSAPEGTPTESRAAFALHDARHPLLELRLRERSLPITPLTLLLPADEPAKRQVIVSGPNTGGKTVLLKTAGLLAIMAQAGLPVPAERAHLPLFTAIFADIGDAQSIENNLSTFSSHVTNVDRIARHADAHSLVLLDELGSATDPEEGAALAVAVAERFLALDCWSLITTHLTSLKVYAAKHAGVLNAAVGFDEATLSPTYELRLGVPGASSGLNIAARLGMDPAIVANARAQLTTQTADIARFLDDLHAQLTAAGAERSALATQQAELARERESLAREGRIEQQQRTRDLERKLEAMLKEFESRLHEAVKGIEDKTVARRIQRDAALRLAGLRRETTAEFRSAVSEHNQAAATPATGSPEPAPPPELRAGDFVLLESLQREARIERVVDDRTLEVSMGSMKMRVDRAGVRRLSRQEIETPSTKRRGGVTVSSAAVESPDFVPQEVNVIGRTAEEAESEVARYIEQAFLAGLPRVRIVHGVGMGVLRRTLRDFLRNHPHVTSVTEPPYNEGGQGATIVDLRQ